ncbi:hypothetical protein ABB37_08866 [Leptomonas pyrrhocoris]|uniref:Uncharacterized protein n=1 Tax=Leptomonas pyrrhocoris TaxID=157538 RepID=A0A0M9FS70_LEPPY|nr:hypothetical protein ABB37_08866 [Leptomonas pyrrhocoris]KPA74849.1 hypothetical protein ABB37_08866 [Leptomonas pyrrhocoris]|eukprot:XP_015653288.1 hypothetical protein ABB37_08866 [Leptomonas pyrrhocoris]
MALEYERRAISVEKRRCEQLRGEVRQQRAAVEDRQKQLVAQEKSQAAARQALGDSWERYRLEAEEKRRSSYYLYEGFPCVCVLCSSVICCCPLRSPLLMRFFFKFFLHVLFCSALFRIRFSLFSR